MKLERFIVGRLFFTLLVQRQACVLKFLARTSNISPDSEEVIKVSGLNRFVETSASGQSGCIGEDHIDQLTIFLILLKQWRFLQYCSIPGSDTDRPWIESRYA
jgi:hypothetical protein